MIKKPKTNKKVSAPVNSLIPNEKEEFKKSSTPTLF